MANDIIRGAISTALGDPKLVQLSRSDDSLVSFFWQR